MNVLDDIRGVNAQFVDALWRHSSRSIDDAMNRFGVTREEAQLIRQLPIDHLRRSISPTVLMMRPTCEISGDLIAVASRGVPKMEGVARARLARAPVRLRGAAKVGRRNVGDRGAKSAEPDDDDDIRDMNVQFVYLLRRVAVASVEEATIRFGVSREEAELMRAMPLEQVTKLASPTIMKMRPRKVLTDTLASGNDQIARTVAMLRSLTDGARSEGGVVWAGA